MLQISYPCFHLRDPFLFSPANNQIKLSRKFLCISLPRDPHSKITIVMSICSSTSGFSLESFSAFSYLGILIVK
jgi:hypothetical protein